MKVYLEPGESIEDSEEFFSKASKSKHEHHHQERFEDPLMEDLLEEMDHEMRNLVLVEGFKNTLIHLLADNPD